MSILSSPAFWCVVVGALFAIIARSYISLAMRESIPLDKQRKWTGYKAVTKLLKEHGVNNNIKVERREGAFNDVFFPKSKQLVLSTTSYDATALSAIASALHEGGHVIQYSKKNRVYQVKMFLLKILRFLSMLGLLALTVSIIFRWWIVVEIVLYIYAFSIVLNLLTLSTEGNASNYGLEFAYENLQLDDEEKEAFIKLMRANDFATIATIFEPINIVFNLFEPIKGATKEERDEFIEMAIRQEKQRKAQKSKRKPEPAVATGQASPQKAETYADGDEPDMNFKNVMLGKFSPLNWRNRK